MQTMAAAAKAETKDLSVNIIVHSGVSSTILTNRRGPPHRPRAFHMFVGSRKMVVFDVCVEGQKLSKGENIQRSGEDKRKSQKKRTEKSLWERKWDSDS